MHTLQSALRYCAATTALGLISCGNPTEGAAPEPGPVVLSAVVNGVPLRSANAAAVLNGAGMFTIATSVDANAPAVSLRLFSISKPGTYPLGVTPAVIGGSGEVAVAGAVFKTPNTGAAGSVTITAVSLTRIVGTFQFIAARAVDFTASDTRTVTDGQFDLPVSGQGTLDVPGNIGSSVTGSISGGAFFATEVTVSEPPSSGSLNLFLRQTSTQLTIRVSDITGVGTYILGGGTARQLRLDKPVNDFQSTWGGTNQTTSGSVSITAVTAQRIQGSITATLAPTFAALGTKPALVSLVFDIGLP
jgi:Family of unknown function (DUF6252)